VLDSRLQGQPPLSFVHDQHPLHHHLDLHADHQWELSARALSLLGRAQLPHAMELCQVAAPGQDQVQVKRVALHQSPSILMHTLMHMHTAIRLVLARALYLSLSSPPLAPTMIGAWLS